MVATSSNNFILRMCNTLQNVEIDRSLEKTCGYGCKSMAVDMYFDL